MADQFFGITDTGKARQNNEDTFIAQADASKSFAIACVIDGVGGYSGGEVAAAMAKETILQRLDHPAGDMLALLTDCFDLANEKIMLERIQVREHNSMACVATLAIVDIAHNQFYYAHVGDTRLYLFRDGSLVKITHDHSFVGFLEESGRLTEQEAMTHPKRNEINRALGFEGNIGKNSDYIETGQSPFLPGDMLLLCSDGLSDMVGSEEIVPILKKDTSLKEKGKALIDAANNRGGNDNITVVLVKNDKSPVKHTTTASTAKKEAPVAPKIAPVEKIVSEPDEEGPVTKKSNTTVIALTILMLLFLGTSVYLYMKAYPNQNNPVTVAPKDSTVKRSPNPLAVKLQQQINGFKGKLLILSDTAYKSPIIINKAIEISKDSLQIKAHGNIFFQADSAYKGPAFIVAANSKSFSVDSVSFNGFDTGITLSNTVLNLYNVRFVNCKQAVQNSIAVKDKKYTSGSIPVITLKADSVPAKTK